MKPQPLLILGTTDYALVFADAFSDLQQFEVAGFVENLDRQRCQHKHGGLPVYWVEEIAALRETHVVICCLSTTHRDGYIRQIRQLGFSFATLIHPTAVVSKKSTVGAGTSVNIGCIVAGFANIGGYVQINRGVTIGHHSVLEDYVTVQPGTNIAGKCHIGPQTYIGIGATVVDGIKIGSHSVIGAGSVVTRDVPANVLVAGVPAKVVKEGINGK